MGSLEGRVALITGASRGIGKAMARRFAAEGASVLLCASRLGPHGELAGTLEGAVAEIESAGGRAAAVVADLVSEQARGDLVARAEQPFGPLDILVGNAAMGRWAMPSQSTLAERRKMLEVNFQAPPQRCKRISALRPLRSPVERVEIALQVMLDAFVRAHRQRQATTRTDQPSATV